MALFRNLGVNQPEADKSAVSLVRRTYEHLAQSLDFADLAKKLLIYKLETEDSARHVNTH